VRGSRGGTWSAALAVVLAVGLAVTLSACGSSKKKSSTTPAATTPAAAATTDASKCGDKPGVAATGTPIKLGAIATKQPGTDFTDIPNMAKAYFDCVNANGGINGHPIQYSVETEQTDPAQVASLAHKLIQTDKVVGIVGNTSIIECAVNHKYYEQQGYFIIDSGIAPECYGTSNSAPVNMGPRYSSDGAVQYAIRAGAKKIVFDQSNVPGTDYIAAGPAAIAKDAGIPITQLKENVPIQDANSVAIKEVQAAGSDGAVVLNFTPPEALKILQAASQQGLADRVKTWACSTPCNTDFLAKSLGSQWNGKIFVNAELTPPDGTNTPTMNLYKAILSEYGKNVAGGIGSFSQMGFVEAELMVKALQSVTGDYTVESVNTAIKGLKNVNTGMLCQQWTYGDYSMHIPNNMDYTVTANNGQMTIAPTGGQCTLISDVDPQIKQYRSEAGTAPLDPTST
jgi:branched-chain amino acid transport system substrate-binding protein